MTHCISPVEALKSTPRMVCANTPPPVQWVKTRPHRAPGHTHLSWPGCLQFGSVWGAHDQHCPCRHHYCCNESYTQSTPHHMTTLSTSCPHSPPAVGWGQCWLQTSLSSPWNRWRSFPCPPPWPVSPGSSCGQELAVLCNLAEGTMTIVSGVSDRHTPNPATRHAHFNHVVRSDHMHMLHCRWSFAACSGSRGSSLAQELSSHPSLHTQQSYMYTRTCTHHACTHMHAHTRTHTHTSNLFYCKVRIQWLWVLRAHIPWGNPVKVFK